MHNLYKNISIVTNVLSKYRIPCFNELSNIMEGHVTFYFLAKEMEHRNILLSDNYNKVNAQWLPGWKWRSPPKDDRHINNILPIIRKPYDIIVLGAWDEPSYLLLWLWGVIAKRKVIFWIESTLADARRMTIKEYYKKLLISKASGCIVPGKKSYEYCRVLGMAPERIFIAPNATDRDFFRSQADRLLPGREDLRAGIGLAGVVILFVGRLVEEYKHVSYLIRAFAQLPACAEKVNLVIVGDGLDRGNYEEMIRSRSIAGVRFLGEMDQTQLCRVYAAADIMVLPSKTEPWGFVLNEAMEFGLPLVITDAVGAGAELIHPGENGFIVPSGDELALTQALEQLINDPGLRTTMGAASRRIVEHFSPKNWAAGVVRAIETVSQEAPC
jgi:glycosyltransferase involved in cell wall biosynthesis